MAYHSSMWGLSRIWCVGLALLLFAGEGCGDGAGEADPDGSADADTDGDGDTDGDTDTDTDADGDTDADTDTDVDAGPQTCELAGVGGECVEASDCEAVGASFMALCEGPPSEQCCVEGGVACSVSGAPGLCIDVAACPSGWVSTAGLCPGAAEIQCCTDPGMACDEGAAPTPNDGLAEVALDPACPAGMVQVEDFCVDMFEASLVLLDSGGAQVGTWSPFHNPGEERVARGLHRRRGSPGLHQRRSGGRGLR